MKKKPKIKNIALLFTVTGILTGCRHLVMNPSPFLKGKLNSDKHIHFRTVKKSLSSDEREIEVETSNHTNRSLAYGITFTLEKDHESQWMEVDPDDELAFIAIAQVIQPGETGRDTIHLDSYPVLPKGKYRIVRQIESSFYTAEFEQK